MMFLCRLSPPPAFDVHSYAMNAVKRPGSLYFSAIVVFLAQTL